VVLGFDSRRGLGIFLFTTVSRTALRPTQPPIQWVRGALSLEVKQPGLEADHSPPSSAEVKEYAFMAWCSLKKHRENFTFTLPLGPTSRNLIVKKMEFIVQRTLTYNKIYITKKGVGIAHWYRAGLRA
jgi:hypothetical protein